MKRTNNKYLIILVKMSIPVLINYLVMAFFDITDRAIVGNYSVDDFVATGVGATVIYGITGCLGAISVAYNIVAAQNIGKNKKNEFINTFATVMCVSLVVGIAMIILSLLFGDLLFSAIFRLEGNIIKVCLEYFYVASITIGLNMITFNFTVYFRNLKDTKIYLLSTIISTSINIVFDYILVYGKFGFPELGAQGAAIGSVLGLISGICVYIFKLCSNNKVKGKVSKRIALKLIKLYVPLLGQDFIEGTLFTFILIGIVSRGGINEIAIYNLAESVGSIMILPVYAFSTSAVTLSIQNSFSIKKENPINILSMSIKLSLLVVLCIGFFIFNFSNEVFGLITNDKTLILQVINIFIFVILMQVFNVFHQIYKGYLQGINNERFILVFTVLISTISIVWIATLSNEFGVGGIYIGLIINNLIFSVVYYLKVKKLKIRCNENEEVII